MNVVIVVDVLNGFIKNGPLASPRCDSVIPRIARLLSEEEEKGSKIVFLADNHRSGDPEFQMFPPHCLEGTEEAEVVDELKPFIEDGMLLPKRRYSGFFGTRLDQILKEAEPDKVIVVGVMTDICVMHTVADLRNRDLRVEVREDCVCTYDAPDHPAEEVGRFALDHMRDILGAEIVRGVR